MAQIRQEINILNSTLSAASGSSATSNEGVAFDVGDYSGTCTFIFEIVADTSVSLATTVTLREFGTTTDDATISIPVLTTSPTRLRVTFTPPSSVGSSPPVYVVFIANTTGATKNVFAARIIILQSESHITATSTQVDIGDNEAAKTNTTLAALSSPKYWKYVAANWNGSLSVLAYFFGLQASTKSTTTVVVQEDDGSFGSWTTKVTIFSGTLSANNNILVASSTFTPTDGRHYRLAASTSSSKSSYTIFCAKLVISTMDGAVCPNAQPNTAGIHINPLNGGTSTSADALAQSFKLRVTSAVSAVNLILSKNGSPTDSLEVDIVSTLGGTPLASGTIASTSLSTTSALYTITFSSPATLTAGTTYYIQLTRSPDVADSTNHYNVFNSFGLASSSVPIYSDGTAWIRVTGTWSSSSPAFNFVFELVGQAGLSLMELQYMLLNKKSTSTGNQNCKSLYDTTEWASVTLITEYAHDAQGATASSKLQDITSGSAVGSSTVTGANQQISGATSAITTGHEIDTNIATVGTEVDAGRLLVLVNIISAGPIGIIISINQAINRACNF